MKNSVKKIVMTVLITAAFVTQVNAAELGHAEDRTGKADVSIQYSAQSLEYIWYGSSSITDIGDQELYVVVETECLQDVDYISMNIRLQKKVNGSWVDAREWNVTDTDTDQFSFEKIYTNALVGVPYRVKTTHTAMENGDSEYTYTSTNGVIVQ